jgi:hypothetical protein
VHHFVERRAKLVPIGFGRGFVNGFAHKFLLPVVPAIFRPRDFGGGKMRTGVKPAGQAFAA